MPASHNDESQFQRTSQRAVGGPPSTTAPGLSTRVIVMVRPGMAASSTLRASGEIPLEPPSLGPQKVRSRRCEPAELGR